MLADRHKQPNTQIHAARFLDLILYLPILALFQARRWWVGLISVLLGVHPPSLYFPMKVSTTVFSTPWLAHLIPTLRSTSNLLWSQDSFPSPYRAAFCDAHGASAFPCWGCGPLPLSEQVSNLKTTSRLSSSLITGQPENLKGGCQR